MLNKPLLFFGLWLLLSLPSIGQQLISNSYSRSRSEVLDINKLYNKKTGEKLTHEELSKIISDNPHIQFERIIDRYGEVERFYYDPDNINTLYNASNQDPVKIGDPFPLFTFKTMEGEELSSERLYGKYVIIRIEVEPRTYQYQKEKYKDIIDQIEELSTSCDIETILLFMYAVTPEDHTKYLKNSPFQIVQNAANFRDKFGIKRYPSTVFLDDEGNLIDILLPEDEVVLKEHICQ